jgi:hypothetical protein
MRLMQTTVLGHTTQEGRAARRRGLLAGGAEGGTARRRRREGDGGGLNQAHIASRSVLLSTGYQRYMELHACRFGKPLGFTEKQSGPIGSLEPVARPQGG